jgi:hypothetical protein
MTRRGHIRKNTIVLDHPTDLPDGLAVEVEVKPIEAPAVEDKELSIEELTKDISYDFDAFWRLREVSKL